MADIPAPYKSVTNKSHPVTNIYFAADAPPVAKPIIVLNACEQKLVNNLAVMDQVSAAYAPEAKSLVSVSLLGEHPSAADEVLADRVLQELKQWYPDADSWAHLKTYHIRHALPEEFSVRNDISPTKLRLSEHHYICGDYLLNGSINAALKTGRLAAELLLSS